MSKEHYKDLLDNNREWRLHILKQLDELAKNQRQLEINQVKLVTKFNLKSGLWGTMGGVLAALSMILLAFVNNSLKKGLFG